MFSLVIFSKIMQATVLPERPVTALRVNYLGLANFFFLILIPTSVCHCVLWKHCAFNTKKAINKRSTARNPLLFQK